jgi:uncharacterized protein YciI
LDRRGRKVAYFAVINDSGPAWNPARARRDQEKWAEHAAFIDAQADERFVIAVGPLSPTRALLIVDSTSELAVRSRLAEDPWMKMGILRVLSIDPWEVLVGKEVLAAKVR